MRKIMSTLKGCFFKSLTNGNKINVHHPSIRDTTVDFRQARQTYHCGRRFYFAKSRQDSCLGSLTLLWRPWLLCIVSNHDLLSFHSMFLGVKFNVHIPMVYLGKYFFTQIIFESLLANFSKEVLTNRNLPNKRSITIWTFKILSFMNWFDGVFENILCHAHHITWITSFWMNWFDMSIQSSFSRKNLHHKWYI